MSDNLDVGSASPPTADGTMLVNLTPHDVVIRDHDDIVTTYPATGVVARIDETATGDPAPGFWHRRMVVRLGGITGLPAQRDGVAYIVSMPCAMALVAAGERRTDVVYPYDLERDAAGRIVGAFALARIEAP